MTRKGSHALIGSRSDDPGEPLKETATSSGMASPSRAFDFPLELERLIFELAALSLPVSIPNLMLIAWRVKDW